MNNSEELNHKQDHPESEPEGEDDERQSGKPDKIIDAQDILLKLKKPADIVNRVLNLELYPSSMLLCTTPLYDKLGGF